MWPSQLHPSSGLQHPPVQMRSPCVVPSPHAQHPQAAVHPVLHKGGGAHPYNRHPFDVSSFQGASVLVVNANFGCGSSREHAPQGLQRWGIHALVGESFAEIFFGNSVRIGLPCVIASPEEVRRLQDLIERSPETEVRIDLVAGTCVAGDLRMNVSIPPNVRDALVTGAWDTTGLLLDRYEEVDAASQRLPYVSGF